MSGVFPVSVCFHSRPQGLGYVEVECIGSNRFHPPGVRLRGHEFHFSAIEETGEPENAEETFAFRLSKGKGMLPLRPGLSYDGLIHQNTFASYTHLYATSCPHWAPAFVELCRESRRSRTE